MTEISTQLRKLENYISGEHSSVREKFSGGETNQILIMIEKIRMSAEDEGLSNIEETCEAMDSALRFRDGDPMSFSDFDIIGTGILDHIKYIRDAIE